MKGYALVRDASGRLVATFDAEPWYEGFDRVARHLIEREGAEVLKRLDDGLDTRYWDFRVRGVLVTLHINWAEMDLTAAEPAAEGLVEELAPKLAGLLRGDGAT